MPLSFDVMNTVVEFKLIYDYEYPFEFGDECYQMIAKGVIPPPDYNRFRKDAIGYMQYFMDPNEPIFVYQVISPFDMFTGRSMFIFELDKMPEWVNFDLPVIMFHWNI